MAVDNRKRRKWRDIKLFWVGKALFAYLAIQGSFLVYLEDDQTDMSIAKQIYKFLQKIDGWGIEAFFLTVSLAFLFYCLREHTLQHNIWVRGLALFFGICTVFGRSYYNLGNWNYVFQGVLQFLLACLTVMGYYLVYKNVIVTFKVVADKWNLSRNMPKNKLETWMFQTHPFLGPLLVIGVCFIPVMIVFFPGTIHADSYVSIYTYLGNPLFQPWTAQQPVAVTWLLAQCLYWSRELFGNDNMMVFLYTGPQYIIQWVVFAYGMYVLYRLQSPIFLRGGTLAYFAVFPIWQIWAYTVVKDSYYYIFSLLLTEILIHILAEGKVWWWQWLLLAVSSVMITLSRNNGMYVLVILCLAILMLYRKYWKISVTVIVSMSLALFVVEGVYMPRKGIIQGPVKEMLSIPLQQTARYVKEHYDEITDDEMEVLSRMFQVEVIQLRELYKPELSDPVKTQFLSYPTEEELQEYFKVWFSQLCKHPDTYIQAFINQTYGYFYPNRKQFVEGLGRYYIGIGQTQGRQDEYINVTFVIKNKVFRDVLELEADLVSHTPLIGMLYSCGFHTYILIGCIVFLLAQKRRREMIVLVPAVLILLICLVSPVDAYLRYMLPVIAVMPLNIAWCIYAVKSGNYDSEGVGEGKNAICKKAIFK